MATRSLRYDHPHYTVRREHSIRATAGATTEFGIRRQWNPVKLKAAHAVVLVAGTATTHGYDIFNGTDSVGTISLGTSTAGSIASSVTLNSEVLANDTISIKSLADATGTADVVLEYEVSPGAAITE